jgi:hypothetical protein
MHGCGINMVVAASLLKLHCPNTRKFTSTAPAIVDIGMKTVIEGTFRENATCVCYVAVAKAVKFLIIRD